MIIDGVPEALCWWPELGMGYYPVTADPYDAAYFEKYQRRSDSPIGRALVGARVEFVAKYYSGPVVDVGIGSGAFIEARPETSGIDVNPVACKWLQERGLLQEWNARMVGINSLRHRTWAAATFWDSLEHDDDPTRYLDMVASWAFVSMPIFTSMEHVLGSKHFNRQEHFWYFTQAGFERWAAKQGFAVREVSDMETRIGREDILTFALERLPNKLDSI